MAQLSSLMVELHSHAKKVCSSKHFVSIYVLMIRDFHFEAPFWINLKRLVLLYNLTYITYSIETKIDYIIDSAGTIKSEKSWIGKKISWTEKPIKLSKWIFTYPKSKKKLGRNNILEGPIPWVSITFHHCMEEISRPKVATKWK